tara:strand:- start:1264 stop:1602 length:339 start_codon:yes stop_codon:yes gene_type:complete
MVDIQYVDEEDIRNIVDDTCEFIIADHGIGHYEYGNGTYTDISMIVSLTSQDIVVQYPIDSDSMIYTLVVGTHYLTDGKGMDYECDYMVELSHIEYNIVTKGFEATYEVNEQ